MIKFITDVQPGELDILEDVKYCRLIVRDMMSQIIYWKYPGEQGWTHDELNQVAIAIEPLTIGGADAYLDQFWIGSTEV